MKSEQKARPAETKTPRHSACVRVTHWVLAASFLALLVSGIIILLSHPRLYWGDTGNSLMEAWIELPIGPNQNDDGWEVVKPFFEGNESIVSAGRTGRIFNKNGINRSIHFLSGWILVITGLVYMLYGFTRLHFVRNLFPRKESFSLARLRIELKAHLHFQIRKPTGGPQYGLLQKWTYFLVVFAAFPLIILSGLAMSPAITAAYPLLLSLFGGSQSARTIHFLITVGLVLFLLIHILMVIRSGFRKQMKSMTFGDKNKYE